MPGDFRQNENKRKLRFFLFLHALVTIQAKSKKSFPKKRSMDNLVCQAYLFSVTLHPSYNLSYRQIHVCFYYYRQFSLKHCMLIVPFIPEVCTRCRLRLMERLIFLLVCAMDLFFRTFMTLGRLLLGSVSIRGVDSLADLGVFGLLLVIV